MPDPEPTTDNLYERLSRKFDKTFTDRRGGVDLTYISGEQVISRLNDELGVLNWSFKVLEHGFNDSADEMWVLGELSIFHLGHIITRQQFGSDKVQRSRSTGTPLDIGFDLKSAATDALKKCATLIGIGLYLTQPTSARVSPVPPVTCEEPGCQQRLQAHEFTDGTRWTIPDIVERSKPYGKVLCYEHLRKAAA